VKSVLEGIVFDGGLNLCRTSHVRSGYGLVT